MWEIILIVFLILIIFIVRYCKFPRINEDFLNFNVPAAWDNANFQDGKDYMENSTIVFTGLIRDKVNNIPYYKYYFSKLGNYFKDYRVVIVENDSKDGTREKLLEWAREDPKVIILGCGVNVPKCEMKLMETYKHSITKPRLEKMVLLRNTYLEYIKKNLSNFDFMFIIDLDIIGSAYIEGISDSFYYFQKYPQIDCISCNSKFNRVRNWQFNFFKPNLVYYDPFALKLRDHKTIFKGDIDDWAELIESKTDISHKKDGLLPVSSAFAGLSICRIKSVVNSNAKYATNSDEVDDKKVHKELICEHVPFYNKMKEVYLNPKLLFYVKSF